MTLKFRRGKQCSIKSHPLPTRRVREAHVPDFFLRRRVTEIYFYGLDQQFFKKAGCRKVLPTCSRRFTALNGTKESILIRIGKPLKRLPSLSQGTFIESAQTRPVGFSVGGQGLVAPAVGFSGAQALVDGGRDVDGIFPLWLGNQPGADGLEQGKFRFRKKPGSGRSRLQPLQQSPARGGCHRRTVEEGTDRAG